LKHAIKNQRGWGIMKSPLSVFACQIHAFRVGSFQVRGLEQGGKGQILWLLLDPDNCLRFRPPGGGGIMPSGETKIYAKFYKIMRYYPNRIICPSPEHHCSSGVSREALSGPLGRTMASRRGLSVVATTAGYGGPGFSEPSGEARRGGTLMSHAKGVT